MAREETYEPFLVCDIGNTAIKFAIAAGSGLSGFFSLPSTVKDAELKLRAAFETRGVSRQTLAVCAAVSVKPELNDVLARACGAFGIDVLFAPGDLALPLENCYDNPCELGADRLVAACGAFYRYPDAPGLIIADYGTAATFDCVKGGAYLGGLIFPGLKMAADSLASGAPRLPAIRIEPGACGNGPRRNTFACIHDGILLGYAAITQSFCAMLEEYLACAAIKIATGGQARIMAQATEVFDMIAPHLVLEGLARIYMDAKAGGQPVD